MRNLVVLLLVLTFAWWVWSIRRAATLFTLRVKSGRIARSSGRIPPRMLADLADVVERAGVDDAEIRCVMRDRKPVLLFHGTMTPGTQQQMRNVAGQFTASEIRGGKKNKA